MKNNKKYIFNVIVGFLLFLLVLMLVFTNHMNWFDSFVYHIVSTLICPVLTSFMIFFTHFCSPKFIILLSLVVLVITFFKKRYFSYGRVLVVLLFLTSCINLVVKEFFRRPRPTELRLIEETGFSFPSAHAMISLAVYGYFMYLFSKKFTGFKRVILMCCCGLLIFVIGLSRIYLGVHYPSDVLAGYLLGFSVLMFAIFFSEKYLQKER